MEIAAISIDVPYGSIWNVMSFHDQNNIPDPPTAVAAGPLPCPSRPAESAGTLKLIRTMCSPQRIAKLFYNSNNDGLKTLTA